MIRTTRILDKAIANALSSFGITKAQLDVLFVIRFSNVQSLKACEIAEELFVSKANISVLLKYLLKNKYVLVVADKQDSRAQCISLTKKAEKLLDDLLPDFFNVGNNALSDLSQSEKKKLLLQLCHIEQHIHVGSDDIKEKK